jgi:hypothetical protein
MRQGSTSIIRAFIARKAKRLKNDVTDGTRLTFHRNTIAWWNPDGSLSLTLAGYGTVTTRHRLNTICRILFDMKPYHQVRHVQYYNDMVIFCGAVITFHPLADDMPLAA